MTLRHAVPLQGVVFTLAILVVKKDRFADRRLLDPS